MFTCYVVYIDFFLIIYRPIVHVWYLANSCWVCSVLDKRFCSFVLESSAGSQLQAQAGRQCHKGSCKCSYQLLLLGTYIDVSMLLVEYVTYY